MKVYAAYKNDEIIKGRLFALPEQAFNFFVQNSQKYIQTQKSKM